MTGTKYFDDYKLDTETRMPSVYFGMNTPNTSGRTLDEDTNSLVPSITGKSSSGISIPSAELPTKPGFFSKEAFFGNKEVGPGWGKTALGALQGIGQFYMGSQQLDLAKKSLAESKSQFRSQFNIQKQQVNTSIMDKARAMADRSAGSTREGAVTDAKTYYDKNKLKETV